MKKHIQKVRGVELIYLKSNPPQLSITAAGRVISGGWTDGTLEPRFYATPPQDGFQEYDFIAQPPFKTTTSISRPITAHTRIKKIPSWLNGVRVYSETNYSEALLNNTINPINSIDIDTDTDTDT